MKIQKALLALPIILALPFRSEAAVNVQTFNHAAGDVYQTTEPALPGSPRPWTLNVNYHFADNPLVEYDQLDATRKAVLIDGIHTLQLTGSHRIQANWTAFMAIQLHQVRPWGESYQGALGDIRLGANIPLAQLDEGGIHLSVIPELFLPTGSTRLLVSNGGFGAGVKLAAEKDFRFLRAGVNVGIRAFSQGVYRNIDYRKQLPVSIATLIPLNATVDLNVEYFQAFALTGSLKQHPGELYLGARVRLPSELLGSAGLSIGQPDFLRANDVRAHLGVTFSFAGAD
ncbi:MAG: hypothetical protein NDJ89_18270 [Oligoflexia bacterium]|nr:hypothetical protein [Oligoflexia bacterium]